MKKFLIILITLIQISFIFCTETEDLKFILGLYSDGNNELAELEISKFFVSYPNSRYTFQAKYLLANTVFNQNRFSDAIPIYLEVEKLLPEQAPNIFVQLIQSYYAVGDMKKAEARIDRFLTDYKSSSLAYQVLFYKGLIASRKGDWQMAILSFRQSLDLRYTPDVQSELLSAYIATSNTPKAESTLQQSLGKANYEINLLNFLTYLLTKGEYDKILNTNTETFTEKSIYWNDLSQVLGTAHYRKGDYKKAVETLKDNPLPQASYYLAVSYFNLKQTQSAKQIFTRLTKSKNLQIQSNSLFYLAEIKSADSPEEAIDDIEEFLDKNQSHPFKASALYLLGYNNYKIEKFAKAADYLVQALSLELEEPTKENGLFLYADALFMTKDYEKSKEILLQYNRDYPQGTFTDEALYKLGIIDFEMDKVDSSFNYFEKIRKNYPNFENISLVYFYLGEFFFLRNDYNDAENRYLHALEYPNQNSELIYSRLASIHYLTEDYSLSENYLKKIKQTNQYSKNLMMADIRFAQKRYEQALLFYTQAIELATLPTGEKEVKAKMAKALYQLKRYDEALDIYSLLYNTFGDKEYLLQQATTLFTQEEFTRAVDYFNNYLKEFGKDENYSNIIFSIANCHYNAENYSSAATNYALLLTEDNKELQRSLDGFFWSAVADSQIDFVGKIDNLISIGQTSEFKLTLLEQKIRYYQQRRDFPNLITTAKKALVFEKDNITILNTLANAYLATDNLVKAEEVFMGVENTDSELLFNWALLRLNTSDTTGALEKLSLATENSKDSKIWLLYLELLLKTKSDNFPLAFTRFVSFADDVHTSSAKIFKIDYLIGLGQTQGLLEEIELLLTSPYIQIRANAQFLKALVLQKQGELSNAVVEFLRTTYLYPKFVDLTKKANILAIETYIRLDKNSQAIKLFGQIKTTLTEQERADFIKKLGIIDE